MATQTWHYLENQFDNATKENFKLMNIINADHIAKLQAQQADPDIAALLTRTLPVHDNFSNAYSAWLSAKGIYKGETDRIDGYLSDLSSTKIKQWDIQIQQVYISGTSDYVAILPNKRKPFQQGGVDSRISQMQALAQRLSAYPVLAPTMNDVLAFHAMFSAARDLQQQKEGILNNASELVEAARKNIAVMMYRNLGFLVDKYASNTNIISNFWELNLFTSSGGAEGEAPPTPPSPPATTAMTLITDQTIPGQVSIGIIGNALATGTQQLQIDYGNGSTDMLTVLNGIATNATRSYAVPGIYTIRITPVQPEAFLAITAILVAGNKATGITLTGDFSSVISYNLYGNNFNQNDVNAFLIKINGYGAANGNISLSGGTIAPPTGQGIAAKQQLISRGWVVVTN